MRYAIKTLFTLASGLWLGGMLCSLMILFTFFLKDRNLAVQVGPTLITTFEKFQAVVGAATLFSFIAWWMGTRNRATRIILPLILIAVAGAVISSVLITPRVNALWYSGQGGTPEFWKWHGISQIVYLLQAMCLLAAIVLTPWAIKQDNR